MTNFKDWNYERKFILSGLPSLEHLHSLDATYTSQYYIPCKDSNTIMYLSKTSNSGNSEYTIGYKNAENDCTDSIDFTAFEILKNCATAHYEKIRYKFQYKGSYWVIDQYIKSTMGCIIVGTVKVIHLEEPIDLMDVVTTEVSDDVLYDTRNLMNDL